MKDISEKAKLQRLYTKNCVRVTVVSNLSDAGFEAQDIEAVTGHKRTASVERYVRRKRDDEKRLVSQILNESMRSAALHQESPAKRFKTNETVQHDEPTVQSSSLNREHVCCPEIFSIDVSHDISYQKYHKAIFFFKLLISKDILQTGQRYNNDHIQTM